MKTEAEWTELRAKWAMDAACRSELIRRKQLQTEATALRAKQRNQRKRRRLTSAEVHEIRTVTQMRRIPTVRLAAIYGVRRECIHRILSGTRGVS